MEKIRVLVTGGSGFVGTHLIERLRREPGVTVFSGDRRTVSGTSSLSLDISDSSSVDAVVKFAKPDVVVHLAAISTSAHEAGVAQRLWATNYDGTALLAKAVHSHAPGARFIFASTAEVYGRAFDSLEPLDETSPLAPLNGYGRSKAAAEMMLQEELSPFADVIVLRLFNHTGPGQDDRFVIPSFASRIAKMERGEMPPVLTVGNLEAARDFMDVRDVVETYSRIALNTDRSPHGFDVLNVGSGQVRTIKSLLDELIGQARCEVQIVSDPQRMRPAEIARAHGDLGKLAQTISLPAKIPVATTLRDVLNYYRNRPSAPTVN